MSNAGMNAGMTNPSEIMSASDAASMAEPAAVGDANVGTVMPGPGGVVYDPVTGQPAGAAQAVRYDPLTGKPIVSVAVPAKRYDPLTGKEIVPVAAKPVARTDYGARLDRLEALLYTVIEKALGKDALPPEYHALSVPEKIDFHAMTTGLAVGVPARAN